MLPTVVSGNELDPDIANGYQLNFVENVFDTLYKFDHNGVPQPNIATADSVSSDGLTHTLTIRSGVTFQDGTKLTADDVAYSLLRSQGLLPHEQTNTTASYIHIKSATATGPTTVVVKLTQPDPDLHNELAFTPGMIVPKAYVEKVGDKGFDAHPIGSGPYEFVKQTPGQSIELQRYPGYWGTKPAVNQVIFTFNTDQAARVAEVEAGTVDLAFDSDPSQVASVTAKGLKVVPLQLGNVQFVAFNATKNDLTNPQIGQALNMAIDRASIVKNIFGGYATLAASLDTSKSTIDPSLQPYAFDPAKAKQMLQSAGFDFSSPLSLAVPIGRWTDSTSMVAAIISNLKDIGVTATVQNMDLATWVQKLSSRTLGTSMNLTGLPNSYYDPIPNWANLHCGNPYSLWCDQTLDNMIASASKMSGPERTSATRQIDQYMHSHPPGIFLFQAEEIEVMSPKFTWNPDPGSAYIKLWELS